MVPNEERPAFAVLDNPNYWGLTKWEYFLAHAPEVPEWFQHKETCPIDPPLYWDQRTDLSEEDKKELRDWHHDPIYDLPEKFSHYQNEIEEHSVKMTEWRNGCAVRKFFAWRVYYADSMIECVRGKKY